MFIPLPDLDDRRWPDLVDEGRALIPVDGPSWTDHNTSDPGITLLELFAFMADTLVYRANRVPEALKLQFAALTGIRPMPPRTARTVVAVVPQAGAKVRLAPGTKMTAAGLPFRTMKPLTATGASVRALRAVSSSGSLDLTPSWRGGDPFAPFGMVPEAGAFFVITLAGPVTAGDTLSLYVGLAGERTGDLERSQILAEAAEAVRECRARRQQLLELTNHHSARTRWEYLTQSGEWKPLRAIDTTRSMTLDGIVRWKVPDDMVKLPATQGEQLSVLRCRLASGEFDRVPMVEHLVPDAVEVEQAEPVQSTWHIAEDAVVDGNTPSAGQRVNMLPLFRADGLVGELRFGVADAPGLRLLEYKAPNGGRRGHLKVEARVIGTGTGNPFQAFPLEPNTAVPRSLRVYSIENGKWRNWQRRENLFSSLASDAHFAVRADEVTVGDAWHGRTVPEGALVIAVWMSTSCSAGNVAAGTEFAIGGKDKAAIRSIRSVTQAAGGTDAESGEHTIGRAIHSRVSTGRAISPADFEELAMLTPGTQIARVAVKANIHPRLTCIRAPGVVTVVIVPYGAGPKPQPSSGLIRTVMRYLVRRRLVGTRVEVIGPEYRSVAVRATIRAHAGASGLAIRDRAIAALNAFLDPLRGGDAGTGWSLGRDVYRSEVLQVINNVPGVGHVVSLELIADGGEPQCGNVCVRPVMLATRGPHEITVIA
jgi:hypothetical protein